MTSALVSGVNITTNLTAEDDAEFLIWPVWSAILLATFTLIGVVGNVFIIGAVCISTRLKVQSNALVVNLAVADLIVSGYVMPMGIATSQGQIIKFGGVLCDINAFITMTTCGVSTQTLMLISVERYLHVCRPHLHLRFFSPVITGVLIMLTWLYTMAWTCQGWTGWTQYMDGGSAHICLTSAKHSLSYTICLALFGMIIPMVVICVAYTRIFSTVKFSSDTLLRHKINKVNATQKSKDSVNKVNNSQNSVNIDSLDRNNHGHSHSKDNVPIHNRDNTSNHGSLSRNRGEQRRHQRETQLLLTLLTIVIVFVLCWFPISVILVISTVVTVPREMFIFGIWLAMCNSTFNSFVYGIMNKNFRDGYKRLFRFLFCCVCDRGYCDDCKAGSCVGSCVWSADDGSSSGPDIDCQSTGGHTSLSDLSSRSHAQRVHQSTMGRPADTATATHSTNTQVYQPGKGYDNDGLVYL